jgi:para-aminobenzoate synthetase component 1
MWSLSRRISPAAAYAALDGEPAFWADAGRGWTVVAPLRAGAAVGPEEWKGRAREALGRPAPEGVPFAGGLVGWFGYEAGAWMERMPAPVSAPPLPHAWLGEAPAAACLDHRTGAWVVVGEPAAAEALRTRLEKAAEPPPPGPPCGVAVPHDDRARYEAGVARILRHLRAGDCYQVNLARELRVRGVGPAVDIWRRLRAANPARRGILVETPAGAVVSNSPELLLRVRGGRALSVPIKGTAPRAGGEAAAQGLLRSAKERAELTMIVDLVRADLGWVAAPGTVRAGPRRVGAVGHVWHAMQRVEAELEEGRDAVDAFAALFPAGSVTGAPKIRAMEVIRDLEAGPRGVYCGAVGWFGGGGTAWWNVAIRTVSVRDGDATLHVGAGIVLGSDPAREWAETELKAERMLAALVHP